MKQLPNILSLLRIFLSISLLWLAPLGAGFYFVYSLCGISDMLDGFIARKIGATSEIGSKLDSAADLIFLSVVMWSILPQLSLSKGLIIWIVLIALVRVLAIAVGYKKEHTLAIGHTVGNKVTGLLLFLSIYALPFIKFGWIAVGLCLVASFSALEEWYINSNGSE